MSVHVDDMGKPASRGVGEWRSELVRHVAECASTSGDRGRGYFTSLTLPPRGHERRGCEAPLLLCVMGSPAAKERGG